MSEVQISLNTLHHPSQGIFHDEAEYAASDPKDFCFDFVGLTIKALKQGRSCKEVRYEKQICMKLQISEK